MNETAKTSGPALLMLWGASQLVGDRARIPPEDASHPEAPLPICLPVFPVGTEQLCAGQDPQLSALWRAPSASPTSSPSGLSAQENQRVPTVLHREDT